MNIYRLRFFKRSYTFWKYKPRNSQIKNVILINSKPIYNNIILTT